MKTGDKGPIHQHKKSQNQSRRGDIVRRGVPSPRPKFQEIPDPTHAKQMKALGFLQTKELPLIEGACFEGKRALRG